jgi:Tfp pilus assembly protein PilF
MSCSSASQTPGYDRLGMVYEARGDNRQAAEYYRKALAFVREHADDYDPSSKTSTSN